jgi:pimeloyl-ACP methyl ester carboxylesterase
MWEGQRAVVGNFDVAAPNLYDLVGNSVDAWAAQLLAQHGGALVPVGASMGGYVAMAMARQAPDRVTGMLLAGARAGADSPERRQVRDQVIAMLRDEGVEAWLANAPFQAPDGLTQDGLIRATEALRDRPDSSDVVASYDGPVWLVVGTEDELLSVAEAREIVESAPRGRLEVVEGAGHIVNQDRPERFNEILAEFVAQFR